MNLKWQINALVVLGLILFYVPVCFSQAEKSLAPIFIAHAGGAVKDKTYTNSLEALETHYEKDFRLLDDPLWHTAKKTAHPDRPNQFGLRV